MSMVKLERRRNIEYTVNHASLPSGTIVFFGAKEGKTCIKEVPEETYQWLATSTNCFKDGSLHVVEDALREDVLSEDEVHNTHTIEEAKAILSGNFMKMKSELGKITSQDEKQFIINVAKEMKLDSTSKQDFLVEWAGLHKDMKEMLFGSDVE